jgi:hypothetical protein
MSGRGSNSRKSGAPKASAALSSARARTGRERTVTQQRMVYGVAAGGGGFGWSGAGSPAAPSLTATVCAALGAASVAKAKAPAAAARTVTERVRAWRAGGSALLPRSARGRSSSGAGSGAARAGDFECVTLDWSRDGEEDTSDAGSWRDRFRCVSVQLVAWSPGGGRGRSNWSAAPLVAPHARPARLTRRRRGAGRWHERRARSPTRCAGCSRQAVRRPPPAAPARCPAATGLPRLRHHAARSCTLRRRTSAPPCRCAPAPARAPCACACARATAMCAFQGSR